MKLAAPWLGMIPGLGGGFGIVGWGGRGKVGHPMVPDGNWAAHRGLRSLREHIDFIRGDMPNHWDLQAIPVGHGWVFGLKGHGWGEWWLGVRGMIVCIVGHEWEWVFGVPLLTLSFANDEDYDSCQFDDDKSSSSCNAVKTQFQQILMSVCIHSLRFLYFGWRSASHVCLK